MTFALFGFDGAPYISLPPGLAGYGVLGLYALLFLMALLFTLRDFGRLTGAQWFGFLALAALSAVLAQMLVVRLPANVLPPPGVPVETQPPGLALFTLMPAFLAGGWLGVGPALLVGAAAGAVRAAWETYSFITPLEYALVAGAVAACVQQDFRGFPAALLRHPSIAGALAGLLLWPTLYLSYFAYSGTIDLSGWDYINSLVGAAAVRRIAERVRPGSLESAAAVFGAVAVVLALVAR